MDRIKRNSKILVKIVGKVFCREDVLKNKMVKKSLGIRYIEEEIVCE